MDVSLGDIELLVGKIGMGEDKNGIASVPRHTTFMSSSTKTTPLKFAVIRLVRVLIMNWLAVMKNFYITDTMEPTQAKIFGDILLKSFKESMGR